MSKPVAAIAILIVCVLFYCFEFFFRVAPSLVTHQLIHSYSTDSSALTYALSLYFLAYFLAQIPAGIMLDRLKFSFNLFLAISLSIIGSIILVMGHHIWVAGLARVICALGGAFGFLAALKIARATLPLRFFTFIAGIMVALGMLTATYGNYLSSFLIKQYGWHSVFYLSSALGVLLLFLLLLTIVYLPMRNTPKVAVSWEEAKVALMSKAVWLPGIIGGFIYAPTVLINDFWGIPFFEKHYHMSNHAASLELVYLSAGWAVGSFLIALLSTRLKRVGGVIALCLLGCLIVLPSILGLVSIQKDHLEFMLVLFGIFSASQMLIWSMMSRHTCVKLTASASALTNMIIVAVLFLTQLAAGSIIKHSGTIASALYMIPILIILAIVLIFIWNSVSKKLPVMEQ